MSNGGDHSTEGSEKPGKRSPVKDAKGINKLWAIPPALVALGAFAGIVAMRMADFHGGILSWIAWFAFFGGAFGAYSVWRQK